MGDRDQWRERDRRVVWHPFTQHRLWDEEDFPVIVGGQGVHLIDADGKQYLDGVSSLWLNVHGHRRPELDRAIIDQLGRIAHSTFLGLSHPPGIRLAERLVELAPPGLTRVFFSDDGSTAIEIALKVAYQYWTQTDPPQPERRFFVTLDQAYHGDTIGAVSLGHLELFHQTYRSLLFPTIAAPTPHCRRCWRPRGERPASARPGPLIGPGRSVVGKGEVFRCPRGEGCLAELDRVLAARGREVAGVVLEPVVQGAAGIFVQPAGFVRGVRERCDRHGVLLIADEVATGFGRTGTMFACEQEGVSPDLMTLGKGLTGGYLPMAATIATDQIFAAFLGPTHGERTFFHGHSYTANPLACAAALASLDLFVQDHTLERVAERAAAADQWLERIFKLDHVAECRRAGLMMGIELEADPQARRPYDPALMMGRRTILAARQKGLIVRPLSDVVVAMPPLSIAAAELDEMMGILESSIGEATRSR